MAKRTMMLLALVGLCGPAYGQVSQVEGMPARLPSLEEVSELGADNCEQRYRTLQARSQLRPSERKAALAICRAAANAEDWQEKLANQHE